MTMLRKLLAALLLAPAWAGAAAGGEAGEEARRDGMEQTWALRAEYPRLDLPAVDDKVAEWLNSRLAEALREAADSVDVTRSGQLGELGFCLQADAFRPSEQVVSVLLTVYLSGQGAHGSSSLESRHFRVADGAELSARDLFRDPELALRILAEQAVKGVEDYLRRQYLADHTGEDEEAYQRVSAETDWDWVREGSAPDWENFRTLFAVPDGVQVWFQQYQALPYAFGCPNFLVPLETLRPAGPNPAVWP